MARRSLHSVRQRSTVTSLAPPTDAVPLSAFDGWSLDPWGTAWHADGVVMLDPDIDGLIVLPVREMTIPGALLDILRAHREEAT